MHTKRGRSRSLASSTMRAVASPIVTSSKSKPSMSMRSGVIAARGYTRTGPRDRLPLSSRACTSSISRRSSRGPRRAAGRCGRSRSCASSRRSPRSRRVTLLSVAEQPVTEAERRALAAAIPKLRVLPPVFHPGPPLRLQALRAARRRAARRCAACRTSPASGTRARSARRCAASSSIPRSTSSTSITSAWRATSPDIESERPSCRIVLDQHNVESDFFKQFADRKTGLKKLVAQRRVPRERALREGGARRRRTRSSRSPPRTRSTSTRSPASTRTSCRWCCRSSARSGRVRRAAEPLLRRQPALAPERRRARLVLPRRVAEDPRARARCDVRDRGRRSQAGRLGQARAFRMRGRCPASRRSDSSRISSRSTQRSLAMLAPVFGGSGVRVKMLEGFRAGHARRHDARRRVRASARGRHARRSSPEIPKASPSASRAS